MLHTLLHFYNAAPPEAKSAARAGAAFLAVLATACSPAHAGAGHGTIAPKPRGPVLVTPQPAAVAVPTEKRDFVMPKFRGRCACTAPHGSGRDGPTREDGRTSAGVLLTSRPPAARSKANGGFLVSPAGAKTMTATPVASAAARTPIQTAPSTSEAQAVALLQATSDATMAKLYLSKGNIPAARRKAVQLLKALQSLEVTA